jgi:hypothetical protein
MVRAALVLLVLGRASGCGAPPAEPAHPVARVPVARATRHRLGMNDVSILLPLPRNLGAPVIAALGSAGAPLVERGWFDALVATPGDIAPRTGAPVAFEDFQIVAARFDLCDRSAAGVCPGDSDGRLRLVLQPLYLRDGAAFAHDIALHAFYPIPAGELGAVVDELRRLAAVQGGPPDAPLGVSSAAGAGRRAYLDGLRALMLRYARTDHLVRLTVIGQVADSAAFAWIFRGLDRAADGFVAMEIPGIAATQQTVQLAGGDTVYRTDSIADLPSGFALATNGPQFAAATVEQRTAALVALGELQNPTLHDTGNTQCIGCHLAAFLTARRAQTSGIDPTLLRGWFVSPYAHTVGTIAREDPRVVRAFGWAGNAAAISQRVANDTAQVLAELEARFPAPRTP